MTILLLPDFQTNRLYSRTSIIRISRLSGLFLWSQFGYDYLLVTIKTRSHILFKTTALKGAVKCKGFCSQRAKAALALVVRRGTLAFSVLRFWQFFRSVFRFLCQNTSVFRFWCSFRFADFSLFSIRFSVFVENNSGFSVLLSNVVFAFSYFESK